MSSTVRINRQYLSRNGMVDSTTAAGWDELVRQLSALSVTVDTFDDSLGNGLLVTTTTARGFGGAFMIHDLACRYGAPVVILG